MPRVRMRSEVYGSVCVCVVCRLLQLLNDERSAMKTFYRLVVTFCLWICKIMLRYRVRARFANCNAIVVAFLHSV